MIPVFVYGTLRSEPERDDWLSIHRHDGRARQIGERGVWAVQDYGLYGHAHGIPAVKRHEGATVFGDLYDVTIRGLRMLLHYESFPGLYEFEEVTARNLHDETDRRTALMFTCEDAHFFGPHIISGDYFAPTYQEVPVC